MQCSSVLPSRGQQGKTHSGRLGTWPFSHQTLQFVTAEKSVWSITLITTTFHSEEIVAPAAWYSVCWLSGMVYWETGRNFVNLFHLCFEIFDSLSFREKSGGTTTCRNLNTFHVVTTSRRDVSGTVWLSSAGVWLDLGWRASFECYSYL